VNRVVALLVIAVAGCGGASPSPAQTPASSPTRSAPPRTFESVVHDEVIDDVRVTLAVPAGWEVSSSIDELGFVSVLGSGKADDAGHHPPMFAISAGLPTSIATMDELIHLSELSVTPVVESPRTRTYVTSQTNDDGSTSHIAGMFHEVAGKGVYVRVTLVASPEDFTSLGGLDFVRALAVGIERPFDVRASLTP
jgi:hypothetical protein